MRIRKSRWVPVVCFALIFLIDATVVGMDYYEGSFSGERYVIMGSVATIPIGLVMYWVRRTFRLVYGLVELTVAIGVAYFVLRGFVDKLPSDETTMRLMTGRTVTLSAVVYFIVRALDNIGEGLKPGSRAALHWNALFPK